MGYVYLIYGVSIDHNLVQPVVNCSQECSLILFF